ncbi:MFS transporter [Georgenia sp. Z1344]|uniref:MFS transporter n=1 Tax=Georgenia sp. Z1344 TaxID=3416706 RepID=UPI003CEE4F3C
MTATDPRPTDNSRPATGSRRWLLLATVGFGLLLITLDNSVLYTALPTLTAELDASASQSLWIINAYPLVIAGLLLGSGALGDRIGHRTMFLGGLVVFGLASLAAAFAPTAGALIAARAFLAVGAAAMMPATLALVRLGFDDVRERNFAIAVWGSISLIGFAIGPIIGGLLLEHFWWGSVFLVNVPIVVLALVVTPFVAPRAPRDSSRSFDVLSSVLALAMLSGAVLAIKEAFHQPQAWGTVGAAAVVAVVAGVLFVRRQRSLADPLLDFSVFRNRAFSAGVLAAVTAMFAIGGVQLLTTQRFQLVAGYTPLEAGLLVTAIAVGSLPSGLLGGLLLHRLGLRVLVSGGLAVAGLGIVVSIMGTEMGLAIFVVGLVLTGLGLGASMSVASTAILGNAPPRRAGMAASVEEVSYEFGGLIAVAVLGSLSSLLYAARVVLPDGAPVAAGESIGEAREVADVVPGLMEAASAAFDEAYLVILSVVAFALVVAATAAALLLRHHGPGTAASSFEGNE